MQMTMPNGRSRIGVVAAAFALAASVAVAGVPGAVLAAADESEAWTNIRETLFPDRDIKDGSGLIELQAPYRALDAAVTPISITAAQPQTADSYIKKLHLIIDENPSPVAAVFHLSPDNGMADISTRVRIQRYTFVRAIAETNDGELYMVARFVKASGGCSAPPTSDREAAMARMGRMKLKGVGDVAFDRPNKLHLLISHPNDSGLAMDQITRFTVPAHFVREIKVSDRGKTVLAVEADNSISENPSFHFYYRPDEPGELEVEAIDTDGNTFKKSWPIEPNVGG
jgi:sulfur-oxidizing protein SoxY